jgi:hypothetical protein
MKATCGHEDTLAYLRGQKCGKCIRKEHAKAVGRSTGQTSKKKAK